VGGTPLGEKVAGGRGSLLSFLVLPEMVGYNGSEVVKVTEGTAVVAFGEVLLESQYRKEEVFVILASLTIILGLTQHFCCPRTGTRASARLSITREYHRVAGIGSQHCHQKRLNERNGYVHAMGGGGGGGEEEEEEEEKEGVGGGGGGGGGVGGWVGGL
jgi:hypothetical protein